LYADHLIFPGARRYPYSALRRVIRAGAQAREQFFQANLRLVMKLAGRVANRTGLPLDDLAGALAPFAGAEVRWVRDWWSDRGIEVTGMQSLLYGTQGLNLFGPPDVQQRMLAYLAAVCRVGAWLGAAGGAPS